MISNFFISIKFAFITFIIFLAVVPLSNGENDKYAACYFTYSCRYIQNVGYPFWGGDRPMFCGNTPKFHLICDEVYGPLLNIRDHGISIRLRVVSIDTSSYTIFLSPDNLFNRCYLQNARNISLISTLKLDENNYEQIRLFYGCTNCDSRYQFKSFKCSDNGTAYYSDNQSDISRRCSCVNSVSFPVDKRGVNELKSTNASLLSILKKWPFMMTYMANFTACSRCEASGGKCGSSEDFSSDHLHFVCYCRDGPRQLVCNHQSGGRRILIFGSGAATLIFLGTVLLIISLIICANKRRPGNNFFMFWSRKTMGNRNVTSFLQTYGSLAPKRYTYADIKKMTCSFKEKLGEGGYGSVYKGKLHDGRFVAVKKLKVLKGDGKDFINEVLSISRTNHVNVITLLGFCFQGNKRALVFEFLPNGSLEKFIHGKENRQSLQWETVFKIAVGIARGLDYLHRGCNTRILHFDIKPHNILLDEEFHPKISDFGLARLCPTKNSMITMSEARGTIGYIAPEVFCRYYGGISHKSDVYSFGMMLIDLVCGRINTANEIHQYSSELYFPEWIYNRLQPVDEAAGDVMMMAGDKNDLEKNMILVSLWCIQSYPSNRPSMNRVVDMLEGPLESLEMPPMPRLSSPARSVAEASPMSTT